MSPVNRCCIAILASWALWIGPSGAGVGFAQSLPTGRPEQLGFSSERLSRIDRFVQREIEKGQISGAVTLVARNGRVVHQGVAGYQDIEKGIDLSSDTIFQIASMTKPVTAVALMILIEEGRLTLDDPVARFIPGFADMRVYVAGEGDDMVSEALTRPLLVRHLATHTGGFTRWGDTGLHRVLREKYTSPRSFSSLDDFSEHLTSFPLLFQPGEQWKYGPSFDALGYLIEVVAGQPFSDFLSERIFVPLDMVDTGFYVPDDKVGRLASRYQVTDAGPRVIAQEPGAGVLDSDVTPSGGGGLVSTVSDYLRFAQMVLNQGELDGVRILSPASIRVMTSNHLPPGMESYDGEGYGIGFGVDLDMARKGALGNAGTVHWVGNDRTHFWIDPATGIIGMFLTQSQPFSFEYGTYMRNLTYQAYLQ